MSNWHWVESSVFHEMRLGSVLNCLQEQKATVSALTSLLLGLGLGLLLRHALGGGDQWKQEDLVWLALPGNLFMRTLTCLSMPLVLPKLITAIGSMDLKEGGKSLGRVLLFYAALNIIIETSGVLVFHAVIPNENDILTASVNRTPDEAIDFNDGTLPFHRRTNGAQPSKTIVTNGCLTPKPSKNH